MAVANPFALLDENYEAPSKRQAPKEEPKADTKSVQRQSNRGPNRPNRNEGFGNERLERRERGSGPKRGGGAGRGGGGRGRGGDGEGEGRTRKHGGFDRRSGTGRGNGDKRSGEGAHNWGSAEGEAKEAKKETGSDEKPEEEVEKSDEEKEVEDNTVTIADYRKEKAEKAEALAAIVGAKKEIRQIESKVGSKFARATGSGEDFFFVGAASKSKKGKDRKEKVNNASDFFTNAVAQPERERRGGDRRGRREGGGRGGGRSFRGGNEKFSYDDKAFPSLG